MKAFPIVMAGAIGAIALIAFASSTEQNRHGSCKLIAQEFSNEDVCYLKHMIFGCDSAPPYTLRFEFIEETHRCEPQFIEGDIRTLSENA